MLTVFSIFVGAITILAIALAIVIGAVDLLTLASGATKYWRLTASIFIGAAVVLVLCLFFESSAIRWIAGFHLFVGAAAAGAIWETRRGRLRTDKT